MTMTEDAYSERERRRKELEDEFSYDGYQVVRGELFANMRDPAIVIRDGNITFNTACINGLEGAVYVKLKVNEELGRLTVQECDKNDKNALRWCVVKGDKRKSRKMTCRPFTDLVYSTMGWDKKCRYRILAYKIVYQGETLYVFDLKVHKIFREKPKKGEETAEPVNTRIGYYPDDIANTFGVSVEEEKRENEIVEMDGYVTMAALTGPIEQRKAFTETGGNSPVEGKPEDYGTEKYTEAVKRAVADERTEAADTNMRRDE